MMRLHALALVIVLAGAQQAQSGAWPREKGSGFAANSLTATEGKDYTGSLYAEYGLTDRLTLGLDVTAEIDALGVITGDGTLFLRVPLSAPDAPNKWAMHLGLGARYEELEFLPSAEVALAWGRGIQWGQRYGWLAVDASYNVAQSPALATTKIDATFGMGLGETTKGMLQIFNTREGDDFTAKLAPSLLYSPKNLPYTLQVGFEVPLNYEDDTALKLGLWLDF